MPQVMRFHSDNSRRLAAHIVLVLALLFATTMQAQGIDVSKYQGKINWTKVSKSKKVKFVYVRATEGASIRDSYYKSNIDKARKAGILVGSYHVYSSKTTAYQQFANFKAVVVKKKQDLVPVLDKLLELMEKEYGAKPMIYTSEKVYSEHFAGKKYSRYHIFVAKYEGRPVIRYTLWQHSKTGRISGISGDVDLDKFHTSHSLYDIRLKKSKPAKPAPKPSKAAAAVQADKKDTASAS